MFDLAQLGFDTYFRQQLENDDTAVARIAAVHRTGFEIWSTADLCDLESEPPATLPARSPPQGELEFAQASGPVIWDEVDQTAGLPDAD